MGKFFCVCASLAVLGSCSAMDTEQGRGEEKTPFMRVSTCTGEEKRNITHLYILQDAVFKHNIPEVMKFFASGVDANEFAIVGFFLFAPFLTAVEEAYSSDDAVEIVRMFLDHRANPDLVVVNGLSVLQVAEKMVSSERFAGQEKQRIIKVYDMLRKASVEHMGTDVSDSTDSE